MRNTFRRAAETTTLGAGRSLARERAPPYPRWHIGCAKFLLPGRYDMVRSGTTHLMHNGGRVMSRDTQTQNQQGQQGQQGQQNQLNPQSQQSGSATRQNAGNERQSSTNDQQRGSSDQQRNIATSREGGRGMQTQQGSQRSNEMTRQQGTSPVYGGRDLSSSPFSLMQRMSADMDRLFEQFGFTPSLGQLDRNVWAPQIETFRRGDKLVIRADVPGVRKDDLHVEVDDGVLTLSGERRSENEENRDGYYRSERSYGQFQRSIALPDGIEADQCQASFNDGVLEVTLPAPKQQDRQPKRIEIR
jgi:HSP20 family protein